MELAHDAARNSNCVRRSVGAALVRNGKPIATGWNGVPGSINCGVAGCPRCIGGGATGTGYEECICVHAEQHAIAAAAKAGIAVADTTLYVNLRPCMQCLAIVIAAGVEGIIFDEDWSYASRAERAYQTLAGNLLRFERIGQG